MAALNTLAKTIVATKTDVDMKTAASTTLYTVPTGKSFIPTSVVIRNCTASLAGGTSYSFTSWLSTIDLSGKTSTATFRELISVTNTSYTPLAAGSNFQITVTTGSSAACTATIDVIGYLY